MKNSEPGKLALEQFFAGELDPAAASKIREHLKICAECSAYIRTLENHNQEFLVKHPYNQWAKNAIRTKELPWYHWLQSWILRPSIGPIFGVALILCIVFPVVMFKYSNPDTTFKGRNGLAFVCQRDGIVKDGVISEYYMNGDKIQITYSYAKKHHIGLLSIDSKGTVSFYHPQQHSSIITVEQEGGNNISFPGSIILDNTKGEELVVALIAQEPLDLESIENWAKELFNRSGNLVEMEKVIGKQSIPHVSEIRTLLLKKR